MCERQILNINTDNGEIKSDKYYSVMKATC